MEHLFIMFIAFLWPYYFTLLSICYIVCFINKLYDFCWINSVEYKVLASVTAPKGSLGSSLNMWIYLVFGFITLKVEVVTGGGGVAWIVGTLNPGAGRPTGNAGTTLEVVLSKSYGLFVDFTSTFCYFLSFFFVLLSFLLFLYCEELEESDESELDELE